MTHLLWLRLCVLLQFFVFGVVLAGPLFDTSTPISFFTNVANRLLSSELNLNLGQLQVYPTNQYTPAVHRLLQVTANILDAQNTNFYPSVFRPLFSEDASSNIFIIGYQQLTNVSGTSDPQLAPPYDVTALLNLPSNTTPIADANGPVNVFGVPWVIGAKQGLPNFNQLSVVSAVQVTRKLEVTRDSLDIATATYATNQMYIMGISNSLGVTFWNSYSNTYPRPVTISASDTLSTTLTNDQNSWTELTNFTASAMISSWPGSQWVGLPPPNSIPKVNSFHVFDWAPVFQSPLPYDFNTHQFDPTGRWYETEPPLPQLPQFGLSLTNYLQAFILDGSNVIDYVQLCSPTFSGGLNQGLADPNYPDGNNVLYQWSTNIYQPAPPTPYGVINQLLISQNPNLAPPVGGQWSTAPTPMGISTPQAEADYFKGFFTPTFWYDGTIYVNRQLAIQAPYTPSRTVYTAFLLQANDPLVHYMSSDMNSQYGSVALWYAKQTARNGVWAFSDDPAAMPLPTPPLSPIGGRYQPWGNVGQMASVVAADNNPYNLAYKDPLAWGSDYWKLPTGQAWSLSWLGQVHRGTPWQTVFLKSTNILSYSRNLGVQGFQPSGSNTWAAWTGDIMPDPQSGQYLDAATFAPVTDWQLVSLLATMLNTNDLRSQFPVNNSDPNAWAVQLDGISALTNLALTISNILAPQYNTIIISSNSAQASIIANGIQSTKAALPKQTFQGIGDILATPQLSIHSPFLNWNTPPTDIIIQDYGISDQAYEAIPSQLLPLLRVDSIGKIVSTNGPFQAQFSGYDGHAYAIQISPDLLNWTSVSTNSPTNGIFEVMISVTPSTVPQFYRTVLIY